MQDWYALSNYGSETWLHKFKYDCTSCDASCWRCLSTRARRCCWIMRLMWIKSFASFTCKLLFLFIVLLCVLVMLTRELYLPSILGVFAFVSVCPNEGDSKVTYLLRISLIVFASSLKLVLCDSNVVEDAEEEEEEEGVTTSWMEIPLWIRVKTDRGEFIFITLELLLTLFVKLRVVGIVWLNSVLLLLLFVPS